MANSQDPHQEGLADPRGSVWRRWDPHLHAPGTALNDQFGGPASLDPYLTAIETASPAIAVLGVTDYYSTACYETVRSEKAAGRLPNIAMLFPNIELRLSTGTKSGSGVNIHLLVSPDDPEHVEQIRRFLGQLRFSYGGEPYSCSKTDLIRLGRAHDSSQTDDHGAYKSGVNQFKVDFSQLRERYDDSKWMRENALIAVEVGTRSGTSGVADPATSFAALRVEMEAFAHIIFSSSDADRRFWLGEGKLSPSEIRKQYRCLKPCLHGCDAHQIDRIGRPTDDQFTWIKGDPTFDALRQACIEPRGRAVVGPHPPALGSAERAIALAKTPGASWLLDEGVPLNPGLVAIIGARGSGKTALADVLAHGAGSSVPLDNDGSFLVRASEHLGQAAAELHWSQGETATEALATPVSADWPAVHYLSQQFVERLCSSDGPTDELLNEIHKVVFAAHDATERLGATDFSQLFSEKLGDTRMQAQHLRDRLDRLTSDVLVELERKRLLPQKERQLAQLKLDITADRQARTSLLGKGQAERATYYERLRTAVSERERLLQAIARRKQSLDHLFLEARRIRDEVFPDLHRELRERFEAADLSQDDWAAFQPRYQGDPQAILTARLADADKSALELQRGSSGEAPAMQSPAEQLLKVSLEVLRKAAETLSKEIGIDKVNAARLKKLDERIAARELDLQKREKELTVFRGYSDRLLTLSGSRSEAYRDVFTMLEAEEQILQDLYRPLEERLKEHATVGRLRLVVSRSVDLEAWTCRGEELLDLRTQGDFKGKGALADVATEKLLPAWRRGTADDVAQAMRAFRENHDKALLTHALVARDDPGYREWTLSLGQWLYSTDHIEVDYSFEYDGLPLGQLSPGMRGIVLLLLYLALDQEDHRPLVIDQPEENLDPRSVYEELVALFREARGRRQVIIVTHNANLVVNTDVDQVIVASCTRGSSGGPPKMVYASGGLENPMIRREVCGILEGGEEAFRERAKRLRVTIP